MTNPEVPGDSDDEYGLNAMSPEELREFIMSALFTPIERKIAERIPRERAQMIVKQVAIMNQLEEEFGAKKLSPDPFVEFDS